MHGLPSNMKKLFTQNVTNITFIFETSPNAKPKEKQVGEHGTLCPPLSGKVGIPHQIAPMLACAAAKLSLFQDGDLSNSIPHGKMLDKSCWPSFAGSRNLKDTKNHFIETKVYKITELVTPHQTLLQHQADYVYLLSRDEVSGLFKGRRDGEPLEALCA